MINRNCVHLPDTTYGGNPIDWKCSNDGGRMEDEVVAYMGWGISAQEQLDSFREEIRELKAENAKLMESCKKWMGKAAHHEAVAIRLRKLLDYALPIAMYAASIEEGDRMRELMSVIDE